MPCRTSDPLSTRFGRTREGPSPLPFRAAGRGILRCPRAALPGAPRGRGLSDHRSHPSRKSARLADGFDRLSLLRRRPRARRPRDGAPRPLLERATPGGLDRSSLPRSRARSRASLPRLRASPSPRDWQCLEHAHSALRVDRRPRSPRRWEGVSGFRAGTRTIPWRGRGGMLARVLDRWSEPLERRGVFLQRPTRSVPLPVNVRIWIISTPEGIRFSAKRDLALAPPAPRSADPLRRTG